MDGLTRESQLKDLRRRLLEGYDLPVRADDELLGLAAVMLEVLQQADARLAETHAASAEAYRTATVEATELVMQRAQAAASQAMRAAGQDTVERVADELATTANGIKEALEQHSKNLQRAVWVSTIAAGLSVIAAIVSMLN